MGWGVEKGGSRNWGMIDWTRGDFVCGIWGLYYSALTDLGVPFTENFEVRVINPIALFVPKRTLTFLLLLFPFPGPGPKHFPTPFEGAREHHHPL